MARRKAAAVLASAAVLLAAAIVLVPCGPGDGAPRPALGPRPARPGPADGFFGEPGESGTPPAPRAGDGSSSIRGSVVDAAGAPVAGAEVVAAADGDRRPVRGATDAAGRFSLEGLAPGAEHLVGARAPGLAPRIVGGVRPGGEEVRIVLGHGARLHGTVRDGDGKPCPGARVRALIRWPGVARPAGGMEVRADEEGRYEFPGFPAVEGEVEASYRSASSGPVSYSVAPGVREVVANVVVIAGPSISGTVRAPDGRPIPKVQVSAVGEGARGAVSGETGEDGAYEVRGLQERPHRVRVFDPLDRYLETRFEGVLAPRSGLDAVLQPNPRAPGYYAYRVLDAAGVPVRLAKVLEFRAGETRPCGSGLEGPGEGGVFRSAQTDAGRYRLVLRAGNEALATEEFAVARDGTADLGTLRLAAGVEVRGRALDAEGRPVPGVRVQAGDDPIPEKGQPDAEGRFAVGGLLPGRGVVRLFTEGFEIEELPWQAAGGATVDLGERRLRPASGVLRGRVVSRKGKALAGARATLRRSGGSGFLSPDRVAAAGIDGRFEFAAVPSGRWETSACTPEEGEEGASAGRNGPVVEIGEGEEREIEIVLD